MTIVLKVDAYEHPAKSVTLFRAGRAEIVRIVTIELRGGENKVDIAKLSSSIDTQSVRVSGLGGAARLLDVVCVPGRRSPFNPNESSRGLISERKSLESEKTSLEQEIELLVNYGRSLTGQSASIDGMKKFLQMFREQKTQSLIALKDIEERIHKLDEAIIEASAKKVTTGEARATVTVRILAEKDSPVTLRLTYIVSNVKWEPIYDLHTSTKNPKSVTLNYRANITQTTGEDWENTQLTLSTSAAQMNNIPHLGRYKIKQLSSSLFGGSTARNANNVATGLPGTAPSVHPQVTRVSLFGESGFSSNPTMRARGLATPSQTIGTTQPQPTASPQNAFGGALFGSSVNVQQQQQQQQADSWPRPASAFSSFGASGGGFYGSGSYNANTSEPSAAAPADTSSEFDVIEQVKEDPQVPLTEATTTVRTTTFSSSYLVEGAASIPSDGAAHIVSIAALQFDAEVTRIAVPRLRSDVYLQCRVKNTSEYRLLPGPVSVFLDEGYVSRTSFADIGVNDSFDCPVGIDPSISTVYERTTRITRTPARQFGDVAKTTTSFRAQTTLINKHSIAIKRLILRDALPITEDNSFKVTLKKPEALIDATADEEVDAGIPRQKVRWSKIVNGKGGEKDGKYEWIVKLEPGEEVTLVAEWDVKAPETTRWYEVADPV